MNVVEDGKALGILMPAGQVQALGSIQPLLMLYYRESTANVYVEGPKASDVLTLLGAALIAYLLAIVFFQRRSITVGAWPWQRGKLPEGAVGSA